MDYFNQFIVKYNEDINMELRNKNKHKVFAILTDLPKTPREIANTKKRGKKAAVNIEATIGHILDRDSSDKIKESPEDTIMDNEVAATTNMIWMQTPPRTKGFSSESTNTSVLIQSPPRTKGMLILIQSPPSTKETLSKRPHSKRELLWNNGANN
jgi:hypothetical protein